MIFRFFRLLPRVRLTASRDKLSPSVVIILACKAARSLAEQMSSLFVLDSVAEYTSSGFLAQSEGFSIGFAFLLVASYDMHGIRLGVLAVFC